MSVTVFGYTLPTSVVTSPDGVYSFWGGVSSGETTTTYYFLVGGSRVVCGTDVINVGAP